MNNSKRILVPRFETNDYKPKLLDRGVGKHGYVYRVADDLVAKVPLGPEEWKTQGRGDVRKQLLEKAIHEFEIASALHSNGISVPKPEGVFSIDVSRYMGNNRDFYENLPAFVMEYINGVRCDQTYGRDMSRSTELVGQEIEKATRLGFIPEECGESNCFYIPEKDKVVLIDFSLWRKTDE